MKWLIEQQLQSEPALNNDPQKGPIKAPWLSWGQYLWDNGVIQRADAFHPEESDVARDGTYHAGPGIDKIGALLLQFFQTGLHGPAVVPQTVRVQNVLGKAQQKFRKATSF